MPRIRFPFMALLAIAFATALALSPGSAQAAKTDNSTGGATDLGGLSLSDTASPAPMISGHSYQAPAGSFKVAQGCRSVETIKYRLNRSHGFYQFHKVRVKSRTIRMRAYKNGQLYKMKLQKCSGQIIWTQRK